MERSDFRITKTVDGEIITHKPTGQRSHAFKRKGDAKRVVDLMLSGVIPFDEKEEKKR